MHTPTYTVGTGSFFFLLISFCCYIKTHWLFPEFPFSSSLSPWRPHRGRTCSRSSLSRCSCDSSCLLWSSRICMRVSRRVLCCRRTRASARSSSSCCPSAVGEPAPSSPASVSMGTDAASSCFHLSRLYSPCSTLRTHGGQMEGNSQSTWKIHPHTHN